MWDIFHNFGNISVNSFLKRKSAYSLLWTTSFLVIAWQIVHKTAVSSFYVILFFFVVVSKISSTDAFSFIAVSTLPYMFSLPSALNGLHAPMCNPQTETEPTPPCKMWGDAGWALYQPETLQELDLLLFYSCHLPAWTATGEHWWFTPASASWSAKMTS